MSYDSNAVGKQHPQEGQRGRKDVTMWWPLRERLC